MTADETNKICQMRRSGLSYRQLQKKLDFLKTQLNLFVDEIIYKIFALKKIKVNLI